VVLEKDGEDQSNRSCEKLGSITQSSGQKEYPAYKKKKKKDGHSLCRNDLLKDVIEEKVKEGRPMVRRGRRRRQLPYGLKESRRYW
jgi:hypothetical protein